MKGDIFPDDHHITRLCGGSHIREDGTIAATAFKPRPSEAYLSVNWLEYLGLTDRRTEIAEVRRVLGAKRTVGTTAQLAVINVGRARDRVSQNSRDHIVLSVRHEPETGVAGPPDASHSGIYGVPPDDNIVPELLAIAVIETHRAK